MTDPKLLIKQARELEDKLRYVLHTGEMNREAYRLLPLLASELEKALAENEQFKELLQKSALQNGDIDLLKSEIKRLREVETLTKENIFKLSELIGVIGPAISITWAWEKQQEAKFLILKWVRDLEFLAQQALHQENK